MASAGHPPPPPNSMSASASPRIGCAAAIAVMLGASSVPATAQNFSRQITEANRVFSQGLLGGDLINALDPTGFGLKGGIEYGLGAEVAYDSNINLGSSANEESDVIFSLTPAIAYTTDPEGGARNRITAFYAPSARFFVDDTSRNSVDNRAGLSYVLSGAKLTFNAFVEYFENSGADRFTGTFSEGSILRSGVGFSYEVSPRTTVFLTSTYSSSDYSGGGLVGSDFLSVDLGFFWAKSELFAFGPAIGYNRSQSAFTGSREALLLKFNAAYDLTDRINVRASVGMGGYENSRNGDTGFDWRADIWATYFLNERWSFGANFRYDNFPSPASPGNVLNDLSLGLAAIRQLNRGRLVFGTDIGLSDYEQTSGGGINRGTDTFWSLFVGYRRPLFNDRVSWNSRIRYSQNSGFNDWDRWQVRTGLEIVF